jgi:hypothetical protein
MPKMNPNLYPGKEEFDRFLSSLPNDKALLSSSDQANLAFTAWRLYQGGLPHRDRPTCLFYFYHFLPIHGDADLGEHSDDLYEASLSSVADPNICKYLPLLDRDKLYEACQQRGTLKLIDLSLPQFVLDDALFTEWNSIRQAAEEFLNSELATPILFLESYMFGTQHYSYKTKRPDARLYEIANQVLDLSTDLRAISVARSLVNDQGNLREYQRKQCPPRDAKKLLALEVLEKQVMSEFGHEVRISRTVGKAIGLLTKAGREQRAAEKDYQSQWVGRVRGTGRSSVPYLTGYTEYLCSWVYVGTDDIKKAIKSLETALQSGFDPGIVLTLLFNFNETIKRTNEAAHCAQSLLDYTNVGSIKEAEESEFDRALVVSMRAAGQEPKFSEMKWQAIQKSNSDKHAGVVAALGPKIQAARKQNVEERINLGIALLDGLIPVSLTDQALNDGKKFSETYVETPRDALQKLSLEEIDLFTKAGLPQLVQFSNPTVSLDAAIDYVRRLHDLRISDIGREIDHSISAFPNLVTTIPIAGDLISRCTRGGHLAAASQLAHFAINKRPQTKVMGFYDAIRPLQKALSRADRSMKRSIFFLRAGGYCNPMRSLKRQPISLKHT